MAQIYKKLEIDVNKEVTAIITAVQNDAQSRYLDVVLLDGSTAINLIEHEVRIYGKKADGTEFYNNGEITNATTGRCQFELTSQALAVAQDLEVQIILFKNNVEILSTQPFKIHVVKSLISSSAIESSNEYGALVVLYQNLYEAYDLMTDMVQNMGEKGTIATQRNVDTFWQMLEYMAEYLDADLTTLLNTVLSEANVQGVIDRLGNTADTGGTATAGTVSAKLNKLIAEAKFEVYKRLETSIAINQTDVTILSVSGAGKFYGFYGKYVKDVKMIVDGVEYSTIGDVTKLYAYRGSVIDGLGSFASASQSVIDAVPFKNSLVIKGSTGSSSVASVNVQYSLYE